MVRVLLLLVVSSFFLSLNASGEEVILGSPLRDKDRCIVDDFLNPLYRGELVVVSVDEELLYGKIIDLGKEENTIKVALGEKKNQNVFLIEKIRRLPYAGLDFTGDKKKLRDPELEDVQDGQWFVQDFHDGQSMLWAQLKRKKREYIIECGWCEEIHPNTSPSDVLDCIVGSYYVLKN